MHILYLLLAVVLLNVVYNVGLLSAHIVAGIYHSHYQFGGGGGIFTFSVKGVKFTMGWYVPVFGFSRIYQVEGSEKKPMQPTWQLDKGLVVTRIIISYAGVLAMCIAGVVLWIFSVYTSAESIITPEEINRLGIFPSEKAIAAGFQKHDRILALNGKPYENFYDLVHPDVITSSSTYFTVLRDGRKIDIKLGESAPENLNNREWFFSLNAPFSVRQVQHGSPADVGGIIAGDRIIMVNGNSIVKNLEMTKYFESDADGKVTLQIIRGHGKDTMRMEKTIQLDDMRRLGITIIEDINYKTHEYSLLQSVGAGTKRFFRYQMLNIKAFAKLLGIGDRSRTLTGPIGISSESFGSHFDLSWLFLQLAQFAANVVLLNFLPVPKSALLDAVPLIYQATIKRKITERSYYSLQAAGGFFIMLILIWSFVSDIMRFLY